MFLNTAFEAMLISQCEITYSIIDAEKYPKRPHIIFLYRYRNMRTKLCCLLFQLFLINVTKVRFYLTENLVTFSRRVKQTCKYAFSLIFNEKINY